MSISVLLVGEAKVRERVPGAAPTVEARGWPSVFLCPPGIGRGLPPGTEWQNPPTGWQPPLAEGHISGDRKSRAPLAAARSSGVGARGEGGVAGVPAIPALPAVCWALFALAELAYSTESSRQVPNVPDL